MEEYKILDVKINVIDQITLKGLLLNFLQSNDQHQIATVNPEFIICAQKNKEFKNIINNCSLNTIDGTGVIWALQLDNHKVSLDQRLTGVELTEIILNLAIQNNFKILFCLRPDGLTSPENFFMQVKNKYPTLDFQVSVVDQAVAKAQSFQPNILLVNLGAPNQELWIDANQVKIPSAKVAVGVGGTFDFMSGARKRAPKIFHSLGLEWLWRLIQQPQRINRISRAVILFPYLVLKNKYNKAS